jgi:hypothetical protein
VKGGNLTYNAFAPKPSGGGGFQLTTPVPITGAGLLAWALVGADLQGTPGFRTFRDGSTYWASDTDNEGTDPSDSGAYALDPTTLQPLHKRVAPMVDLSRVEMSKFNRDTGNYEIPAEIEKREAMGMNLPTRDYAMFLDAFGGPILYWRADPAGAVAVDASPNLVNAQNRGTYHFLDNGLLLTDQADRLGGMVPASSARNEPVILRADRPDAPHNLIWDNTNHNDPRNPQKGFEAYIRNEAAAARVTPYNPDSYLMISAGADGIFGSADDIANFEHNGAELTEPN